MKIIMVYPLPSPVSPQKNPPLSVIYPGMAAEQSGHEVEFWEARLDKEAELWPHVSRADIVAISSLSGFQLEESMRIAAKCKEQYPTKPIVWGGVHVTFQPIESLREIFVDFVVIGEGEKRFPQLIRAIDTGRGFGDIDGIGYKRTSAGFNPCADELKVFTERPAAQISGVKLRVISGSNKREVIEFHDPDGPYGDIFVHRRGLALDLAREYVSVISQTTERLFIPAAKRNEITLPTSRGCNWSPTSCTFCSVAGQYTQIDPKTGRIASVYRYIPYEVWARDLLWVHNLNPFTFIELEDENSSTFVKDWRYAELLRSLEIRYHLHLRSDQLQKEKVIERLAATGCDRIHIGAESGNNETLKYMRKNEVVESHYNAAKLLAKHGVEGVYTWIIGNPNETTAQIMDTLRVSDEIRMLHPIGKSRATIYVLMPLPGTIAFQKAKEAGWPLPTTMEGWTNVSAACNPQLPAWMNNLYFIAGFHHNRHHKTTQNFPGWWRLLIFPLEFLMEWRWQLGIRFKNQMFFQFFNLERFLLNKLLKWRSHHSLGQGTKNTQMPKLLERLLPGMAGH